MPYQQPDLKTLIKAARGLLTTYTTLMTYHQQTKYLAAFFGHDLTRLSDIAFIQRIAEALDGKKRHTDAGSDERGYEGREDAGVKKSNPLILVGAFLYVYEQISSPRSALFKSIEKALNLTENNKMDDETRHTAFGELYAYLSEQPILEEVNKRQVKKYIEKEMARYIASQNTTSQPLFSLPSWFSFS